MVEILINELFVKVWEECYENQEQEENDGNRPYYLPQQPLVPTKTMLTTMVVVMVMMALTATT